jgi:hypothetical protein
MAYCAKSGSLLYSRRAGRMLWVISNDDEVPECSFICALALQAKSAYEADE